MRRLLFIGGAVLLLMAGSFQIGSAKDLAINQGFELMSTAYWTEYGTVAKIVDYFDVDGNGGADYCIGHYTGTGADGGLTQMVYLKENQPYTMTVDIAYYNC